MKRTFVSLIVSIVTLLALPASFLNQINFSHAAYDPGNIIADAEFINSTVLDANGIQRFLNTRGGTRLRTYSEGGRTAAQIIADAARSNGISPYVILATIQKEESLVDSNTNFDFRVTWAMGYGVCDSCSLDDPDVARRRGFTNQVDNGAWQLKYNYGLANGSSDYSVGRTMIIDGTAVRFANRATPSLYRYTPHLGGNQNFYNIYNNYKSFYYKAGNTKEAIGKTKAGTAKQSVVKSTAKTSQSTPGNATYNAEYVRQVGGNNMSPGQQQVIYIYLKNTGGATWNKNGSHPVRIGSSSPQDRGSAFTGGNVRWQMINSSVAPGKIGVFSIRITSPSATGTYTENFRPLAEGITWFGNEVSFTFNVGGTTKKGK